MFQVFLPVHQSQRRRVNTKNRLALMYNRVGFHFKLKYDDESRVIKKSMCMYKQVWVIYTLRLCITCIYVGFYVLWLLYMYVYMCYEFSDSYFYIRLNFVL